MKQYEAVIKALEARNGVATLAELYRDVPRIPGCTWATKTPQASIRRIVQLCKDIFKIKPGLYGLVSMKRQLAARGIVEETPENKQSEEVQQFNHTYYQGLLLLIGRCRKLDCWAPNQDRNKRFLNQSLGELRTVKSLPPYSYVQLVKRSESIDVIWLNRRKMPDSFFEVEYSTDMQNSLLKFHDLQDFSAKMFIVADAVREREYNAKLGFSAFHEVAGRINFLNFERLVKLYELEMARQGDDFVL